MTKIILVCGAALALCVAGGSGFVSAQTAEGGFTFKRVKVEKRPVGSKINIQITPEEFAAQKRPPGAAPDVKTAIKAEPKAKAKSAPNLQDWFWTKISPQMKDAAFDRMEMAVRHMQTTQSQSAKLSPSSARLRKIADRFGKDILRASIGTNVSPALLLAVISVESGGNPEAVSSAGAQGLMQLIPATAERFNVKDATNPTQNVTAGATYLSWLIKEFRGDPLLALAGYNAGENAVKKHNGVPPFPETRAYVPKVVAAWAVARTLCTSQPVLTSDACVFRVAAVK